MAAWQLAYAPRIDFEQGFEAEFATSGFTRPLGFEVRDASHVEGAFEASFGLEEADTVERTEVGLDANLTGAHRSAV